MSKLIPRTIAWSEWANAKTVTSTSNLPDGHGLCRGERKHARGEVICSDGERDRIGGVRQLATRNRANGGRAALILSIGTCDPHD
jgi:hypothetical protein